MTKNYKRGFGFGTFVVIIALVLIVGGYIYYNGQNTAPATSEATYSLTGTDAPVNSGQPMETGDVVTPTGTSTVASSSVASSTAQ